MGVGGRQHQVDPFSDAPGGRTSPKIGPRDQRQAELLADIVGNWPRFASQSPAPNGRVSLRADPRVPAFRPMRVQDPGQLFGVGAAAKQAL